MFCYLKAINIYRRTNSSLATNNSIPRSNVPGWVANETISYNNSMKADVYCCLLDCTKAFDRFSFKTLFVKWLKTVISAVLLHCLFFIYSIDKLLQCVL